MTIQAYSLNRVIIGNLRKQIHVSLVASALYLYTLY